MEAKSAVILVVDDNPVNRVLCSRFLEAEGYTVLLAEDGIEALRLTKEEPVDLILLDVMMPGLSGFDVLSTLRKLYSSSALPIVMATAKNQSADVIKAFNLGANDYLTKPLDIPVVLARIRAQLRARSQSRRAAAPGRSILGIKPGIVLEEKYRLESLIGGGNFGTVYRATHLKLRRPVAVKVLNTGVEAGDESVARFQREGISTCRVSHPNAVEVLDLSVTSGGVPFLVMELLEGRTLANELERESILPPARCSELLAPICDVLGAAHAVGIIHRDIKPQNIFLHRSRQGEVVKVLDFGIAKLLDDSKAQRKLTVDGLLGTPSYMAPERFGDEPCDGATDVYSLGIMLYQMLVGRLPFILPAGDMLKLIYMHMNESPTSLCAQRPELSPELETAVLAALAKDSSARPSPAELNRSFAASVR